MKKIILSFSVIFIGIGCTSSKSTLQTEKIANFDKQASDHILFLDFSIKKNSGQKPEIAKLTSSVSGSGLLKNIRAEVHNPYQIKSIQYFNNGQKPVETRFEHPLYRSVELFDVDGSISRKPISLLESRLSMRIQHSNSLAKMELYSTTPDNGTVLIYTLNFKP